MKKIVYKDGINTVEIREINAEQIAKDCLAIYDKEQRDFDVLFYDNGVYVGKIYREHCDHCAWIRASVHGATWLAKMIIIKTAMFIAKEFGDEVRIKQ
jgi:hypothetical protein